MHSLWKQSCDRLNRKSIPMSEEELVDIVKLLPTWRIECFENARTIRKVFNFDSSIIASLFVQKLSDIQDEENHHAKITIDGKKVDVIWWTHLFNNLHRNDFVMAAKTDFLYLGIPGRA
ncbi:MAG: 4a-hydroxytetrahydrobiopterin dehydratase [SAR202 cluster bacterium]|nr:4a-hydroxytetrahydrobiopterin dehydratase [SAR202 cluster bacterium]